MPILDLLEVKIVYTVLIADDNKLKLVTTTSLFKKKRIRIEKT